MVFDSHVHWLDIDGKPEWYTDWPPKGDKGTLRESHLPKRYFDEANNAKISSANHLQVAPITAENEWINSLQDSREKSSTSMTAWLDMNLCPPEFDQSLKSLLNLTGPRTVVAIRTLAEALEDVNFLSRENVKRNVNHLGENDIGRVQTLRDWKFQ